MATCTRCAHFSGKNQTRSLVDKGLYRCTKLPIWTFISPFDERECAKFTPVAEADLPARIQFEKAQGGQ